MSDLLKPPPEAKAVPGWIERHWQTRVAEAVQKLTEVRDEMNNRARHEDEPHIVRGMRVDLLNDALLSLEQFALPDDEINIGETA